MAMTSSQVTEVDTARLASAAGTLKEKIQKAETSFQNVMNIVKNTNRYWIGEAGDEHHRDAGYYAGQGQRQNNSLEYVERVAAQVLRCFDQIAVNFHH